MARDDNLKEVEFTEEEFFQLGLGNFLNQNKANLERVVVEKLVDFSGKDGMLVEFDFFQEISDLGKQILSDKLEKRA